MQTLEDTQARRPPIVVGVGASAGGLRPLQELFGAIDPNIPATFIVVQHLSEDFESVMDELLARTTSMKIEVARQNVQLLPAHIYLNPPGFELTIRDGRFFLKPFPPKQLRMPINLLLESLAREYQSDSVGVILSGTGSDGSDGIRHIHATRGLTIVQDPDTAQFDGMPKNALFTGCSQATLAPKEIALLLKKHAKERVRNEHERLAIDDDPASVSFIFRLLSAKYGIDFGLYKPATVARRIDRRLLLTRQDDLRAYVDTLQSDEEELDTLYHDLLIGVTRFFRDPEAFDFLKELIALDLRKNNNMDQEFRIWSAGCATGEEAYSLAILMNELQKETKRDFKFKIFATDIHERTLAVASAGIYDAESLSELPASRRLFFQAEDGKFRIHPHLRSSIVFAKHDVIDDPPFTRMNLVVCRNLLIYLQPEAQRTAISGFSFALNPGGLLMLGPSEALHQMDTAFDCEHKEWRIFRRNRNSHRVANPAPRIRQSSNAFISKSFESVKAQSTPVSQPNVNWKDLMAQLYPAGIILDRNFLIRGIFGDILQYFPRDHINRKLSDYFQESSRAIVDTMLAQAAAQTGQEVRISRLVLLKDISGSEIDLTIRFVAPSIPDHEFGFVQLERSQSSDTPPEHNPGDNKNHASLENELVQTRENLSATILQLESGNEELQAANEELVASNEELQATNEELQSVNEELHTVNLEHQRKVEELEMVTNDFNALFDSTRFGSILLDRKLHIRKFTRNASKYFSLITQDIGRPLSDFASTLVVDNLSKRIDNVLDSGNPSSVFASDRAGRALLVEILPYLVTDSVEGVILNVIDVLSVLEVTDKSTQSLLVDQRTIFWQFMPTDNTSEVPRIHFSQNPFAADGAHQPLTISVPDFENLVHPEDTKKTPFANGNSSGISSSQIRIKTGSPQYKRFELVCVGWEHKDDTPARQLGTMRVSEP